MKIAIIGSGVTGLGAAYALQASRDITLYEKDARLGGHANTVSLDYDGVGVQVDTGFIVFNRGNYPNLVGLLDALKVETVLTDMAFGFSGEGLEWCSNFPRGVFAQKRNLTRPAFLSMLSDIGRFNRLAARDLKMGRLADLSLGGYMALRGFCEGFQRRYLMPMGAAIWSTTEARLSDFPAESFVRFFANHGLLQMRQPMWGTIKGGSRSYVDKIGAQVGGRVRLNCGAVSVRRTGGKVEVRDTLGGREVYDHVIMASHSNQSLDLLADADGEERGLLSAIRYAPNRAVLHRDPSLMPERRAAWGSWNYMTDPGERTTPASVTYWMNKLQGLPAERPLFVSLNPPRDPRPDLTFAAFDYEHPQFDGPAIAAQRRFGSVQGRGGVWHAGAWLGYGFHEDGLTAGLRVAQRLGGEVPWRMVDHRIEGALPALATPG
ncbi:MAG: NADH-ubiquinone oxidoreductase subunit 6, partial [Caulobacteraceae bacterium]|nr:NADH-ubiquinone oxidoreductase subunit 6 [Caulobacteraceae bacterium]